MDKTIIDQRNKIAQMNFSRSVIENQDAYDYIAEILRDAQTIEYLHGEFGAYINMVLYHATHNQREGGEFVLKELLKIIQQNDLSNEEYLTYHRAHAFFANECLGNYALGLKHLEIAKGIAEELDDKIAMNRIDSTLGVINHMIGNNEIAEDYLRRMIPRAKAEGNRNFLMNTYYNYAAILCDLGQVEKADEYCNLSLEYAEKDNVKQFIIAGAALLGSIKGTQNREQEGVDRITGLLKEVDYEETHYYLFMILSKAILEMRMGCYPAAYDTLSSFESLAEMIDHQVSKRDYYKNYAEVCEHLGNYESAYKYMKIYHDIAIAITDQEASRKMASVIQKEYQKSLSQLESLAEIGRSLAMTNSIKDLVQKIKNHLSNEMPIDGIGIGLYRDDYIYYDYFFSNASPIDTARIHVDDPNSLAAWCIREKNNLHISDLEQEAKLYVQDRPPQVTSDDLNDIDNIASIMYAPLIVKSQPVGVFTIQSNKTNAFDHSQMEAFKIISSYVSIAIANINQAKNLEKLTITDTLTGVLNRRGFNEYFEVCRNRADTDKIALLMIDIDHFKRINDRYGHLVGDEVLKRVASFINGQACEECRFARVGGEEFGLLIINHDVETVKKMAEHLRSKVEALEIPYDDQNINLTISIGLCAASIKEQLSLDILYHNADQALYRAKRMGRNRVEFCDKM